MNPNLTWNTPRGTVSLTPLARPDGATNALGAAALEAHRRGDLEQADRIYRRRLHDNPHDDETLNLLGLVRYQQGQYIEAVGLFQRAIAIQGQRADYFSNLGIALKEAGCRGEARAALETAIDLDPTSACACNNLGNLANDAGSLEEAMGWYERSIALDPEHADAHVSLALLALLHGDMERGWREYEWRFKSTKFVRQAGLVRLPGPRWDGTQSAAGTLLVRAEQGAGDVIQFARYLPLARQRVGRLIFECQAELHGLMEGVDGLDLCIDKRRGEASRPDYDWHVSLLSLPRLFATHLNHIPAATPYIRPPGTASQPWEAVMGVGGVRVGLVWAGRPQHERDAARSLRLLDLEPLAVVPGVTFFSLQVGAAGDQAKRPPPGMRLVDMGAWIRDYRDTAAIISRLDLIISVDTSVAHLAGALGRPVWTLLADPPDWRWLLNRPDSPWYPGMRLFRQSLPGDWQGPIRQAAGALRTFRDEQVSPIGPSHEEAAG